MSDDRTVVGGVLVPHDIDAYFFVGNVPEAAFCSECGSRVNKRVRPERIHLGKRSRIGMTYDGVVVFDEAAVQAFVGFDGCHFEPVETNRGKRWTLVEGELIAIDESFSPIGFDSPCQICGGWVEVSHYFPTRLVHDCDLPANSVRFSIREVGYRDRKHRLVLLGLQVCNILNNVKLSGLLIEPVYSSTVCPWWR